MKESEERARLVVAIEGLKYVLSPDGADKQPVTRSKLCLVADKDANDALLVKAAKSKSWQKPYAERLVEFGFFGKIQKDSSTLYEVKDHNGLLVVIKDWVDQEGEIISKIVFPDGMDAERFDVFFTRRAQTLIDDYKDGGKSGIALFKDGDEANKYAQENQVIMTEGRVLRKTSLETEEEPSTLDTVDNTDDGLEEKLNATAALKYFKQMVDGQKKVFNVTEELYKHVIDLSQDVQQLKAEFRRQEKAQNEAVAAMQGVMRLLKEQPKADAAPQLEIASSLEAALKTFREEQHAQEPSWVNGFNDALRTVGNRQNGLSQLIQDVLERVGQLETSIHETEKRNLGGAARTVEAALEMFADALAESKK